MEMVFAIGISILSPRSCGSDHPAASPTIIGFQPDATSNLGKPSYWRSRNGLKLATLVVSIVFLLSLFLYMMVITQA